MDSAWQGQRTNVSPECVPTETGSHLQPALSLMGGGSTTVQQPVGGRSLRWPIVFLLACLSGCVTTDKSSWKSWKEGPKCGQVTQLVVLWGDGVVVQADPMQGGAKVPGFACRAYLFGKDYQDPLRADGHVLFYLFEDKDGAESNSVPLEIWDVKPEDLEGRSRKDLLGWGYDLWIPWRTYRPDLKQVHLRGRYQTKEGTDVWGDTAVIVVQGQKGPKSVSSVSTSTRQEAAAKKETHQGK
jgi:hypothetical protein